LAGINAAVGGVLGAALYNPIWLSAVANGRDVAIALAGFLLVERTAPRGRGHCPAYAGDHDRKRRHPPTPFAQEFEGEFIDAESSALKVYSMITSSGPIFQVGHLERLPLGTPYPDIVAYVGRLLRKLPDYPQLVIDCTGVGRPIFEMFVYRGISPIGAVITAGHATARSALCQSSRRSACRRRCCMRGGSRSYANSTKPKHWSGNYRTTGMSLRLPVT
jgi:hypothetical protein